MKGEAAHTAHHSQKYTDALAFVFSPHQALLIQLAGSAIVRILHPIATLDAFQGAISPNSVHKFVPESALQLLPLLSIPSQQPPSNWLVNEGACRRTISRLQLSLPSPRVEANVMQFQARPLEKTPPRKRPGVQGNTCKSLRIASNVASERMQSLASAKI